MNGTPFIGATQAMLQCAENSYNMYQGGNERAAHHSYHEFFREVAQLDKFGVDYSKWEPWNRLAEISGFRWMHPDFCMVSEKPIRFEVNDNNEGHCTTGPYKEWADGSGLYMVNGVRVPGWVVESPQLITVDEIDSENNAEIKRTMIEIYGTVKYLQESGAECIDFSAGLGLIGSAPRALYQTKDGLKFLYGTDGSTKREYTMPVPSEAKTCAEAHCLISGLDSETRLLAEC